jgi:D-arabinose 5-phosphate isomerase GutQ
MRGQIIMDMFKDAMMFLTRCVRRINVDCGAGKIGHVMQKLVADFLGNLMSFFN